MQVSIDASQKAGSLPRFWRGTGFTPAKLLLTPEMQQALTYIGSLPRQGIQHVRVHYLLDLVRGERTSQGLVWDWSLLDRGLDALMDSGLQPFFEVMGNPSGLFSDFGSRDQLLRWRDLTAALAEHLLARYGTTVTDWYFETWNEPDVGWWHQWPADVQSFLNYYDATAAGLWSVNDSLVLGGPGTCRTLSPLFCSFLEHCDTGTNYFTGEAGTRLDFISIHEKGIRSSQEALLPDTVGICLREGRVLDYITEHHPRFADLPFMNNECDLQVGWRDTHTWRAKSYYAANVIRVIRQHLEHFVERGYPYALLSNDNGFLGSWGQRTLLARFGDTVEVDSNGAAVWPSLEEFELVKKPVYNAMVMLSMLGSDRLVVECEQLADGIGAIASSAEADEVTVLLFHAVDEIHASGSETIRLSLSGLPFTEAAVNHYRLDADHGCAFTVWEALGAPPRPDAALLQTLRHQQELPLLHPVEHHTLPDGELELEFELPLPGVSLLRVTRQPDAEPPPVKNLRLRPYAGTTARQQVMLQWDPVPFKGLQTYEVLLGETADGPWTRVNKTDLLCSAYLHVFSPGMRSGWFRIAALDVWGRRDELSDAVYFQGGEDVQ